MFDENPLRILEPWQLAIFFLTFSSSFILVFLVISILIKSLINKQKINKSIHKLKLRTSLLCSMLLSLYVLRWLEIPHNYYIERFIVFVRFIVCLLVLLLSNPTIDALLAFISHHSRKNYGNQQGILQIIASIIKVLSISLLLIILPRFMLNSEQYQIDKWLSHFTIGAGTITAIAGFASKDLISNFFGALVIMMGKPFQIGDWIIVNKIEGRVISIDIRATKLQTKSGTMIYVPNSMFTNKDIINYGQVSYQFFSMELPLVSLDQATLKHFLAAINQAIQNYSSIITKNSFIEIGSINQQKSQLKFHISFQKMAEEEAIQHLYAFIREIHDIAEQKNIPIN